MLAEPLMRWTRLVQQAFLSIHLCSRALQAAVLAIRGRRGSEIEADRQLGQLLHGLPAGKAGVVGGAAGNKHDPPAALDGPVVVHQAPQRDALLVVRIPGRVHPLLRITQIA